VSPWERWLVIGTPAVAMATVGLGLQIGARRGVRAALVYGAPQARAGLVSAWQIVVSDEQGSFREPVEHAEVGVLTTEDGWNDWHGATNGDGVAEAYLPMRLRHPEQGALEVLSGGTLLAEGNAHWPSFLPPAPPPPSPWAPFARREGALEVDVAVLGERVAPSLPASVFARVRDAATHAPVVGAEVSPLGDSSLATFTAHAVTDSRGWAEMTVTPAGLAVSFALGVRGRDGRTGTWVGGLTASPGAAYVGVRSRESPDVPVDLMVVAPLTHKLTYLEIDDDTGRAWGGAVDLAPGPNGNAVGNAQAPALKPGLYWAVSAGDPVGASALGPGTLARPFFVAKSDEEALAFGHDPAACALPHDVRETGRAVDTCLAMAVAAPVPRWVALDGFAAARERDAERHSRGLAVALGGVAVAVLLEAVLLLRSAGASAAQIAESEGIPVPVDGRRRRWSVAVALLTGLLGFALLAAFLVRLS
jgi:hypothetical protein